MHPDFETLSRIAQQICDAEGGSGWNVASREDYLKHVVPGGTSPMAIHSIIWLGPDQAIVTSIVSMIVNGQATAFERARRFVRSASDEWKLAGSPSAQMA